MPNTRIATGKKIVQPLHELERTIDLAMIQAAQLLTAMAQGRVEARLAATVGQGAFDELGQAVQALAVVRGRVVATHAALDETRAGLNLPATAFGDESEKLPRTAALPARHLASVA